MKPLFLMLTLAAGPALATGPQIGSVNFITDSDSFVVDCELDFAYSTPDEFILGLVCDDPKDLLNASLTTGSNDTYQIEDATDGQLYVWNCPREGRLNLSHSEFLAAADCRSPEAGMFKEETE